MAESSALSFSLSFHLPPGLCRPADPLSPKLTFASSSSPSLRSSSLRTVRCRSGDSGEGGCFGGDPYGPYPWESSTPSDEPTFQWIPEDKITLFTSEGLVHIGGSLVPRHFPTSDVVAAEKASKEGLQEKLTMTVAVPLLWGVPPASETLRFAVRSGGGIVEKVYWQWDFL